MTMKIPVNKYLSRPFRLITAVVSCLLLTVALAPEAQAAVTITRTSAPTFYTNSNAGTPTTSPQCTYLSFNVYTDTAINDAWATIGNFGGGNLGMGSGDDGITHFGPMMANETRSAFYYVCSTYGGGGTVAGQTYDVTAYSGNPLFGGTSQGVTGFSTTIDDGVIQASANSVNAIWADINPSVLGATTTLTVDGDTGTIGCVNPPSTCTGGGGGTKGPLAFNPATFTDWRPDAYELVGTSIVLSVGNSGTYDNVLYIDNVASGSSTHYVATYYFRPIATTAATTTLSPVSYLASGTQIKHTNLGSGAYAGAGGLLPIQPAQNVMLLSKSVSHATLPAQGGTVTYTVTATNTGAYDLSLDSFNDVLPAGATYVANSTTFNDISFVDPVISGSNITWSSLFTIPAGSARTLIYQVTLPATPGLYTNSITARIGNAIIDTTLATSDNVPATATTRVLSAPTITKAFSPTALAITKTSVLTLTITNPNSAHTLNGIAVGDALPAGLVFAVPSGAATTCPSATLSAASGVISITGGTLTVGQSCTVSVNVTSAVNDIYNNTTGAVSSSNGGTGSTASAAVTFSPKPTISKSFSVSSIPLNGTATLTFTITNNTAGAITGMTFSDTYPVNLVNAATPNVTNSCGGTITAAAGGGSLSLAGGGIAAVDGTCSISVDVTSATAGIYANTSSGVDTVESTPAGPVSNTATLTVMGPPTVAKAFSPSTIAIGQTSTLTITLSNANASAITGAAFIDTYPANVTTAVTPNASTTCASGIVNSAAGSVSLSGAIIPASGSCTVSIDVTSSVLNLGGYTNTIAAGGVTTTNAGSNAALASAILIVNATPTIAKSFTFNPVTSVGTMNITITNNDVVAITALSFTDLFPSGMTTANPPSVSPATPCGAGSSIQSWNGVTAGTLTATGGDTGIKLTSGQIAAAGSCTFSINLVVDSLGVYTNQTSGVTGSFAGSGNASNTATWIAPRVGKTFTPTQVTPTTIGPSDISRIILRITNPSLTTALTGLAITDTYPTTATKLAGGPLAAALTSPTPNESNTCGGTVTATATGISLSGGTLAPGANCEIGVDVLATNTTPAAYTNTTGKVGSDQGIGVSGSDTLVITASPTVRKAFSSTTTPLASPLPSPYTPTPATVTLSGGTATSNLTIEVENNSGVNITAVAFSDTFPTGMVVAATPNVITTNCGTPTVTAAAGSNSLSFSGGAITSAAPVCTITLDVTVSAAGTYTNTTTGVTSSANTIVGPTSNAAQLIAHLAAPTVTKSFANAGFQVNGTNTLTITLTNPNTANITGAALTDTYPANMVNASTPNLTNSCGGTATAAASADTLSLSGGIIPASGSCTLTVDVTATAAAAYTNTLLASAVTSNNANAGPAVNVTANTTAYLPPTLTKSFGTATLSSGSSTSLTLSLTNPGSNTAALTGVTVADLFPTGMTLFNTTFTFVPAACGTVTKISGAASVAGDNAIRFNVASLAIAASCQVSVNVTSSTPGAVTNTTLNPIATGPAALAGIAAWADITVSNSPSITLLKTVSIYSDPVNGTTSPKFIPGGVAQYTIIASNSGGPADNDSIFVIDAIPTNTVLGDSGQVVFTQGATSSTLTYNMAADRTYSNDGGTTWTASPTFDGTTGCDTTVPPITHIRMNPKGIFIGGTPNPSFQLTFRVCVK